MPDITKRVVVLETSGFVNAKFITSNNKMICYYLMLLKMYLLSQNKKKSTLISKLLVKELPS